MYGFLKFFKHKRTDGEIEMPIKTNSNNNNGIPRVNFSAVPIQYEIRRNGKNFLQVKDGKIHELTAENLKIDSGSDVKFRAVGVSRANVGRLIRTITKANGGVEMNTLVKPLMSIIGKTSGIVAYDVLMIPKDKDGE